MARARKVGAVGTHVGNVPVFFHKTLGQCHGLLHAKAKLAGGFCRVTGSKRRRWVTFAWFLGNIANSIQVALCMILKGGCVGFESNLTESPVSSSSLPLRRCRTVLNELTGSNALISRLRSTPRNRYRLHATSAYPPGPSSKARVIIVANKPIEHSTACCAFTRSISTVRGLATASLWQIW